MVSDSTIALAFGVHRRLVFYAVARASVKLAEGKKRERERCYLNRAHSPRDDRNSDLHPQHPPIHPSLVYQETKTEIRKMGL